VALENLRITYDKQDEQLQKKLRRDKHNGKTIYKLRVLYRYNPEISIFICSDGGFSPHECAVVDRGLKPHRLSVVFALVRGNQTHLLELVVV